MRPANRDVVVPHSDCTSGSFSNVPLLKSMVLSVGRAAAAVMTGPGSGPCCFKSVKIT